MKEHEIKQGHLHYRFNVTWFNKDGDGMQTNKLKAFYCISANIKQTVLALLIKNKHHSTTIKKLYNPNRRAIHVI